jgi:protein-L-isoaspartate(D-aspartate) O-methyltransferase
MTDRELARSPVAGPDTPAAARARLAADLHASGRAPSPLVQEAFAVVPRHLFVPEMGQAAAYRDEAFVLKCGPDGIPVSSSSQPAMMAIMLEQLGLRPGHRVLEIGTGSGYNAALMSVITGPDGRIVSIDIDPEIAARARSSLARAGFSAVQVRCADGGFGDPAAAPFDRIIVTAGVWDVAPDWLDQLADGGRLVLPLSVRDIELSVALERADGCWRSQSACRCGFVRMLGAFASPQPPVRVDGPEPLLVQLADDSPVEADALRRALGGRFTDVAAGVLVTDQGELGDLDLWLTCTEPELARITLLTAAGRHLGPLPLGGLAWHADDAARIGIATVLPVSPDAAEQLSAEVIVRGYGPGGEALAGQLAARALSWAQLGRPGAADVQLSIWPSGAEPAVDASAIILDRPSSRLAVGWAAPVSRRVLG